ncbi:MAG: hypothetical protein ACPGN3_05995 [Opitutales bacterium]
MRDDSFDNLINSAKKVPLPEPPGALEDNVLRRIRLVGEPRVQPITDWLINLVPKPAFVGASIAVAVAVSACVTMLSLDSEPELISERHLAARALDFDVFQESHLLSLP